MSRYEEAVSGFLLNAGHAAAGHPAVIICFEDRDVFVSCLAFSEQIGVPLFQRCGTQTQTQSIDIGSDL